MGMSTDTIAAVIEWKVRSFDHLMKKRYNGIYCAVGQKPGFFGGNKRIPLAIGYGNPIGKAIKQHNKIDKKNQIDDTLEIWCGTIVSALPAGGKKRKDIEIILRKTLNVVLAPPFNEAISKLPEMRVFIANQWSSETGYWPEPPCDRWPDFVDCRDPNKSKLVWLGDYKIELGPLQNVA